MSPILWCKPSLGRILINDKVSMIATLSDYTIRANIYKQQASSLNIRVDDDDSDQIEYIVRTEILSSLDRLNQCCRFCCYVWITGIVRFTSRPSSIRANLNLNSVLYQFCHSCTIISLIYHLFNYK